MGTTKAEAPERVWIDEAMYVHDQGDENTTEYVRADLAPAGELVSREAAENAARDMADRCVGTWDDFKSGYKNAAHDIADAIAALPPVARVPVAARAAAEEIWQAVNYALKSTFPLELQAQCEGVEIGEGAIEKIEKVILKHCGSVTPTQKDSD